MLDNYFQGVIEQTVNRVGSWGKNMVFAKYTNDFSLLDLDCVKRYSEDRDNVFFACYEYDYYQTMGAYEPFLQIICQMYKEYVKDLSFDEFLTSTNVYELHREIFLAYFEGREIKRIEPVILSEVSYEQKRMAASVTAMLRLVASYKPLVLVINRFQLASRSSMEVVENLLKTPSEQIGLVMASNDEPAMQSSTNRLFKEIEEALDDENRLYHMGDSGQSRVERRQDIVKNLKIEKELTLANIAINFLDYEYASLRMERYEYLRQVEDLFVPDEVQFQIRCLKAYARLLNEEISAAVEILANIEYDSNDLRKDYMVEYLKAMAYMYQGKLQKSVDHARICKKLAQSFGDEESEFLAELLEVEASMSGWYNIFFCVQDVEISERLLEKLMKYQYINHLAHIYIYAYDNGPEVVAKAYRSEAALMYFSRGVELAKKIGNIELVCAAYQKNLMIAAANGMFEIAVLYSIRIYQVLDKENSLDMGRIYSGLGYNLSALGDSQRAEDYYTRAIAILYKLRLPEDIAEVHYNMALNYIQMKDYEKAEHYLLLCMKAIERLHLNSLRVANLSKLYALLALVSILLGDRFNGERYLQNCRQFLNYIMERENNEIGIIHDYARCDDDMFLYTFARGLVNMEDQSLDQALECFLQAEKYMMNSEGNQFYAHVLFREKRMELFSKMGREMLYEIEKEHLEQKLALAQMKLGDNLKELLLEVELSKEEVEMERIPEEWIENLMKQEGLALDLQNNRRQMDFISSWQKQIDVTASNINNLVEQAMKNFLNHFNIDCALYIRYHRGMSTILFDNTKVKVSDRMLSVIEHVMMEYPQGFAVSKISGNYYQYQELISLFGQDEVCSFVAVPFFKERRLQSVLITYVMMQDNWHSSIERYMLTEDDLNIYKLLFQEMSYSINRIEAYETVFEMNKKLSQMAVTDMLTGIYNRSGMYQEIKKKIAEVQKGKHSGNFGLMFVDLDNFKNYNDTFGHKVGDAMLVAMTKIFTDAVEDKGFVCRYGGDEFILILDTCDRIELEEIAKGIFGEIARKDGFKRELSYYLNEPVALADKDKLSCSIGISLAKNVKTEADIQEMMMEADSVLYKVKEGTKGTYAFT